MCIIKFFLKECFTKMPTPRWQKYGRLYNFFLLYFFRLIVKNKRIVFFIVNQQIRGISIFWLMIRQLRLKGNVKLFI
jgi:hypothetical protein